MLSIEDVLKKTKTVAVIGLSDKVDRPSYQVAKYLISQGLKIIPVNPMIDSVFELKSYKSFKKIPKEIKIDIVDIFRRSEEVLPIIREIIESGRKTTVWLQEGVFSKEVQILAKENGLELISGVCLMKAKQKN